MGAHYQAAQSAEASGDFAGAREALRRAVKAGEDEARLPLAGVLIDARGGPVEAHEAAAVLAPLEAASPIARRMMTAALALGRDGWAAALDRRITHAIDGDRDAVLEIGLLLAGTGSPEAGAWLTRAETAGSGHAAAALIRLQAATGALRPGQIRRLDELAAAGYPLAAQLRALASSLPETGQAAASASLDPDAAKAALGEYDVIGPGRTQSLNSAPRIAAAPGLLHPVLCDYLLAAFWPLLARAKVFSSQEGRTVEHPHRRAWAASIPVSLMDLAYLAVHSRMAALSNATLHTAEPLAILVYYPGDEYRAHLDCFSAGDSTAKAELEARGQRVATTLTVLNQAKSGGDTRFPRLDLSWRGETGDALSFDNVTPGGQPDPLSLHAGTPVETGWKALASLWLRERAPGPDGAAYRTDF